MSYFDIYKKRLNRWGTDYQTRIQKERENQFELYLQKSVYRVNFDYDGNEIIGSLEKYKQDETETLAYLLTSREIEIPNGSVLMIPKKDNDYNNLMPWMVYYLEQMTASGYNRYILLKMTHYLTWTARDGSEQSAWAYLYGQEDNMLKDEIRSRSRSNGIYNEPIRLSFFVTAINPLIRKEDYFVVETQGITEHYRVTGYDITSSLGIEYVTIDPVYEYDLTPLPVQDENDTDEEFFWLNGGILNDS